MSVKPECNLPEKIVIGTRGSPLALVQSNIVKDEIAKISQDIDVSLKVIRTSGDWSKSDGEVRLNALDGGKAQFAKEIEDALLSGEVDIAVHSMKDMETCLPDGLVIPHMLPREDVRDAFLSVNSRNISALPDGCVVGSASVRRQAFLLSKRPDIKVVPFRGNVQTRIDKLKRGQVDATFLACAGLNRLGLSNEITSVIEVDDMLPAVGQGAVGIEMRSSDQDKLSFISQLACMETYICVSAERGVLRSLGGSCHTPIGVYAKMNEGEMHLRICLVSLDGEEMIAEDLREDIASYEEAVKFGEEAGAHLKSKVKPYMLANMGL